MSVYGRNLLPSDSNKIILISTKSDTLLFSPSIGLNNLDNDLNLEEGKFFNFNPNHLIFDTKSIILNNGNILSTISLRQYPSMIFRSYNYIFNDDFDSLFSVFYPNESRSITQLKELPDTTI